MELKNYFAQWAGEALPGATCYLYLAGTETLATGLQDANEQSLGNPISADPAGLIQFAAPNGVYDLRVMHGGRDYRVRVQCVDVAEQVAAAQAEADRAVGEATTAAAAAANAETARDAAQASGNVYPDTAAGLAATVSGEYFSVPASADAEYVILYMNESGAAIEKKRYPSTMAVSALQQMIAELEVGEDFVLMDEYGHVVIRTGSDGKTTFPAVGTGGFDADDDGATAERLSLKSGETMGSGTASAHDVADVGGRCATQVDEQGRALIADAHIQRQFRGAWDHRPCALNYEINHVLWYGQSWSLGFDSVPAITTAQRHNTLMFNGGIRQLHSVAEDATALQSFVPAVEATTTGSPEFPTASLGETGAVAFGGLVTDLIERENNIRHDEHAYQLLLSAPGEGSKSIEDLSDDASPQLLRVYEQIERGYAIAQSLGKTYAVQAVTWMQGANQASGVGYADQLETLRAKISAYAKIITGQAHEVVLITWQLMPQSNTVGNQTSARGVYERFVSAADTYPHIICAGPSYQAVMVGGTNIHLRPQSSAKIGEAMGLAYKRTIIDGTEYQPLRPMSLRRQGRIATLQLNVADGHLVRDVERVLAAPSDGFNLYDSTNSPITISSVEIIGRDTIKIVADTDIPAGARLRYADLGIDYTESGKRRGNIRDNSYHATGVNRWLVAFSYEFHN